MLMQYAYQMAVHACSVTALIPRGCLCSASAIKGPFRLPVRLNQISGIPEAAFSGLAAALEHRQTIHPGHTRASQTNSAVSGEPALPA